MEKKKIKWKKFLLIIEKLEEKKRKEKKSKWEKKKNERDTRWTWADQRDRGAAAAEGSARATRHIRHGRCPELSTTFSESSMGALHWYVSWI